MRTLVAAAVACSLVGSLTHAQNSEASIKKNVTIAPQDLSTALQEFAQETKLYLIYAQGDVINQRTDGASGELSQDEALKQLLHGTGLTYRLLDENTITIVPLAMAPPAANQQSGFATKKMSWRVAQADTAQGHSTTSSAATSILEGDGRDRLEEIIVTAQKREERLRDVPQSMTALPIDELTRAGALQFRDYADTVPGLAYNTNGAGYTQVVLRGVTTGYETLSTVAIYVDEVPYGAASQGVPTTRMALDAGLFDLDRIEVLRGPQGTLYGASAVGGLVKYVSKRPSSDQFEGQAQLGFASTEQGGLTRSLAGAVNLPISEGKAGVRLSAFYNHDGGYIDNLSLGQDDVNQADIYGGRADLLLTPTEQFSVRLAAYAQDISRDGESSADFTFAGPPLDSDMTQRRVVAEPFDQQFRVVSATLNYNFDWAELTSISGYQTIDTGFTVDENALLLPYLNFFFPDRGYSAVGYEFIYNTDKFNQEIRLASARGERFEWSLGGFYSDEDNVASDGYRPRDAAGQPATNDLSHGSKSMKLSEYAGFGTLTWHLTDQFDISGGIRYAEQHQSQSSDYTGLLAPPPDAQAEVKADSSATTYLANARYVFNDQSMLYARYATGYRSGGPNSDFLNLVTGVFDHNEPYDSDSLSSYEVGFRHETADHRFSMDMAAYSIDWKDAIISTYDATTGRGRFTNAAGIRVHGGELALTARPVSSLTLAVVMAYTDAYITGANSDLGAAKGERVPTSPRFNGSLTADYSFSGTRWQPTLGAAVRYMGDRTASFDGNTGFPQYDMPAYTAVDLRAGLSFAPYDVQLYVRNLLDERGQVSAYAWQRNPRVAMLQPRTIGFTVTTRF